MAEENLSFSEKLLRNMFQTRVCPVCGKTLVRLCFKDYVYKRDGYTFCSWDCMRKYDKDHEILSKKKINRPLS